MDKEMEEMFVIRIRGLPYSANENDIKDFFKDQRGLMTGDAYLTLSNEKEVKCALNYNEKYMGSRYIEGSGSYFYFVVFRSDDSELHFHMRRESYVLRLRGLPFDAIIEDVVDFFRGVQLSAQGVALLMDHTGRCTGEGFVRVPTTEMLKRAKSKHHRKIGHRYIEIFDSTIDEANHAIHEQRRMNRIAIDRRFRRHDEYSYGPMPSRTPYYPRYEPFDSRERRFHDFQMPVRRHKPRTNHTIRMRGLPFSTVENDIEKFFAPIQPVSVFIKSLPSGRASGEADVDFCSHDEAKEAMKKDRDTMGQRYIELFLESVPDPNGDCYQGHDYRYDERSDYSQIRRPEPVPPPQVMVKKEC